MKPSILTLVAACILAASSMAQADEPPQVTYKEIQRDKFVSESCYVAVQYAMTRVGLGHAEELAMVRAALIGAQSAENCRYLVSQFVVVEERWQNGDEICETAVSHFIDYSRRDSRCHSSE